MHACACVSDPVDQALHAVGCCTCALYAGAPPQTPLTIAEAEHLLGRFGFHLEAQADHRFVAVDAARGIQTPEDSATAYDVTDLSQLVVRARCADRLAGPLTIAEATATLAGLGFALKTNPIAPRTGRRWWAISQERAVSTGWWGLLKDVVTAARAHIAQDGYRAARQRDLPTLTDQVPHDLDPTPRRRFPARAHPAPLPDVVAPPTAGRTPAPVPDFSDVVPPTPPATPPAALDAGRNPTPVSGFSPPCRPERPAPAVAPPQQRALGIDAPASPPSWQPKRRRRP